MSKHPQLLAGEVVIAADTLAYILAVDENRILLMRSGENENGASVQYVCGHFPTVIDQDPSGLSVVAWDWGHYFGGQFAPLDNGEYLEEAVKLYNSWR